MKTSFLPAGVALATCAAGLLIPFGAATAAPGAATAAPPRTPAPSDVREVSPDAKYSTEAARHGPRASRGSGHRPSPRPRRPGVGTQRQWLGLDDFNGTLYRKAYTLRGVGDKIEVWVANDTSFPAGDCRGAASTVVTDAQVDRLVTRVRRQHVPEGDRGLQHAARPRRHQRARSPATTPVTATRPSR